MTSHSNHYNETPVRDLINMDTNLSAQKSGHPCESVLNPLEYYQIRFVDVYRCDI